MSNPNVPDWAAKPQNMKPVFFIPYTSELIKRILGKVDYACQDVLDWLVKRGAVRVEQWCRTEGDFKITRYWAHFEFKESYVSREETNEYLMDALERLVVSVAEAEGQPVMFTCMLQRPKVGTVSSITMCGRDVQRGGVEMWTADGEVTCPVCLEKMR